MQVKSNTMIGAKLNFALWILVAILFTIGIAANFYYAKQLLALRLGCSLIVVGVIAVIIFQTKQGIQIKNFAYQSYIELRKIIWPSRKETVHTTLMVMAVVAIMGMFLWGVDSVFVWFVGFITGQRDML